MYHMATDEQGPTGAEPHKTTSRAYPSWSLVGSCLRWFVAALLAALVGTWLVWFAVSIQRQQNEEDIRAACRRVMPETADRCFDTVIIQRGGVRR